MTKLFLSGAEHTSYGKILRDAQYPYVSINFSGRSRRIDSEIDPFHTYLCDPGEFKAESRGSFISVPDYLDYCVEYSRFTPAHVIVPKVGDVRDTTLHIDRIERLGLIPLVPLDSLSDLRLYRNQRVMLMNVTIDMLEHPEVQAHKRVWWYNTMRITWLMKYRPEGCVSPTWMNGGKYGTQYFFDAANSKLHKAQIEGTWEERCIANVKEMQAVMEHVSA